MRTDASASNVVVCRILHYTVLSQLWTKRCPHYVRESAWGTHQM